MTAIRVILVCTLSAIGLLPTAARADAGHDGAAHPASGLPGAGISRVEAQSDAFEIVGVVQSGVMTIFLDRYTTNDPVVDAKIEIDAGSQKGSAQANPDGTYTFRNAALAQPGPLPITFAIVAGNESDLLAGELVIADPAARGTNADDDPLRERWWWVAGALALLAGIAVVWWSRRHRVNGVEQ